MSRRNYYMSPRLDTDTMGERLIAIVASVLRVPAAKLTLETGPGDLEVWDSLAQINLVSEIEAEFGVSIPIEQVAEIRHIRDFLRYVEKTS
jgi:acyl carrier protein